MKDFDSAGSLVSKGEGKGFRLAINQNVSPSGP